MISNLNIDGQEYRLISFSFEFKRDIDRSGLPQTDIYGGIIRFAIEITSEDSLFSEWAVSQHSTKNGQVAIYFDERQENAQRFEFQDAYVINYKKSFELERTPVLIDYVEISARIIQTQDWEHENEWPM